MNLDRVDKRIDTFQQGRKGFLKKNRWPFSNQQAKKKFLDGEFLAKLGFYFKPTTKDHVVCYFCDLECNWNAEYEHPLSFHLANQPCSHVLVWAKACSRNEKMKSIVLNENEEMIKSLDYQRLLLDTFKDWPHGFDKSAKQGLCAEMMASAGFCYQPMTGSPDHTCCTFCSLSLEGWDLTDEPIVEHRKRSADCIFFKDREEESNNSKSPKSKKKAPASKKYQKKKENIVEEQDLREQESPDDFETLAKPLKAKKSSKKETEFPQENNRTSARQKKAVLEAAKKMDGQDAKQSEPVVKRKRGQKAKPLEEDGDISEKEIIAEPSKRVTKEITKKAVVANDAPKRRGRPPKESIYPIDVSDKPIVEESKPDESTLKKDELLEEVADVKPKRGRRQKRKESVAEIHDVPLDIESDIVSVAESDLVSVVESDVEEANQDIHESTIDGSRDSKKRLSQAMEEDNAQKLDSKKIKKSKKKDAKAKSVLVSKVNEKKTRKKIMELDEDKENEFQSLNEESKSLEKIDEPDTISEDPQEYHSLSPVQSFSFPADTTPQLLKMTQELMSKTNLQVCQVEEFLKNNQDLQAQEFLEKLGTMAREKLDTEWTRKLEEFGF